MAAPERAASGNLPGGALAYMGHQGSNSVAIPYGAPGLAGVDGGMSVGFIGSSYGSLPDSVDDTSGEGSVTAGYYTLGISARTGLYVVRCMPYDPRAQYNSAGQYVSEMNEPMELKIAYQWLTTSGAVNVLLGGQTLAHLDAPAVLTNGLTSLDLQVTSPPAPDPQNPGFMDPVFQLNGPAQIQFSGFSLQSLPLLPLLSVGSSSTNPAALDLDWYGASNETYQVQSRAALNRGDWTDFGPPISGLDAAASLELPIVRDANSNRFYRIVMTAAK